MKSRGFTFLELLTTVSILSLVLLIGFSIYLKEKRVGAVLGAARFCESAIRERKQRAAALGVDAGLCFNANKVIRFYEYHPFASGAFIFERSIDLSNAFAVPVGVIVGSTGAVDAANPCDIGENQVQMTSNADPAQDWEGTITLFGRGRKSSGYRRQGALYDTR